ncbi:MAG: RNA-guided pseudouridylation complex pseudouridine synthase subunit Cbf5 [Candidatus Altiarchaeota archaeon]|nr:RNA-guided pseudouridylation complex pseudouridine synthase subunit Cbf5 [Candidatus Altiarchaeota archaeon]
MGEEILVKSEDETDPSYGCIPLERPIEELLRKSVINLDKPRGPTSHQVSSWVKRIMGIKTGHGGTLDPAVSGVLPIFLGTATRLAETLLLSNKEYVCLMRLHSKSTKKDIMAVFKLLQGELYQKPPVRSSVKRELRTRTVYYTNVLEIDENSVLFKIGCQAGTYVRKYCHDFGLLLGTEAHMQELRRTKGGCFREDDTLVTLQDIKDAYVFWKDAKEGKYLRRCLLPMELAVSELPKVWIRDSSVDSLCHGADLAVPGLVKLNNFKQGDLVAVMTLKDELVALGDALEASETIMRAKSGHIIKTNKVFMDPGTYPKTWSKNE